VASAIRWLPRALVVGVLALAGCAGAPPMAPQPPTGATRVNFGRVALVSLSSTREFDVQIPYTKHEAAGEAATKLGLGWVGGAPQIASSGGSGAFVLAACLMWTPVGLTLGSAYGSLAGERENQLRTNAAALGAATATLRFEEKLKDALLQVAEQQAGCTLAVVRLPLSIPTAAAPSSQHFHGVKFSFDQSHGAAQSPYLPLAKQGFRTVLEIKSYQPGLVGSETMNPRLAVSVDVRVRLLDALSGGEVYYDYLQYRGPKRRFAEWAVNDAQPLRVELESCCRKLADEIVAQTFVRPDTAPVDAVALAQSGIRRK